MVKLHDRVVTKKIGPPAIGDVVGLVKAEAFIQLWTQPLIGIGNWDLEYPDWRSQEVATLEFDQAAFLYSLDELYAYALSSLKRRITLEEVKQVLDLVKLTRFAHYPVEDLEIF